MSLIVEDVVLAETVWTLSSLYKMRREDSADALLELLQAGGVVNPSIDDARPAVPVSRGIAAGELLPGRTVALLFFDPHNPDHAMVTGVAA